MAQAIAIAAPRAEELTSTITGLAGAGFTGVAEGLIVRIAPKMGAAAPMLTWGALIGTPVVGTLGALFTRGMLSNMFMGVAAAGAGILGYSLPELIAPTVGRRAPATQLGGATSVKQLPAGTAGVAARAAAGARSVVEF